jgi:DNA-binding LacI/PurR family transcriptional regulator
VAQPMLEMGSAACRRLFEAIDSPGRLQTIQFPMSLTARESTAAPRVRVWPAASAS